MTAQNASSAVDVPTARALLANNPDTLIVDVRTPGEFETAHVPGSINLPLDQVDAHLGRIVNDAGGRMLLMCQSGNGMNAWITAGGPVERGRDRWSLERQVRLVAGGIVLLSIVASIWLPSARFVAGFIGAGLTFAALTNTCAMGMMLSRLPYNRGAGCDVDAALARLREEQRQA
jgi:rhodanese-related sulfurtransferase